MIRKVISSAIWSAYHWLQYGKLPTLIGQGIQLILYGLVLCIAYTIATPFVGFLWIVDFLLKITKAQWKLLIDSFWLFFDMVVILHVVSTDGNILSKIFIIALMIVLGSIQFDRMLDDTFKICFGEKK